MRRGWQWILDTLGRYSVFSLPMHVLNGGIGPHFYAHGAIIHCYGRGVSQEGELFAVAVGGAAIRIRLLGVNWQGTDPEYQARAKAWLNDCVQNKALRVECVAADDDGTILSLVWSDVTNVNYEIVRRGLVRSCRESRFQALCAEIEYAESLARTDGNGVWAISLSDTRNPQPHC
jgi:endonuclease YncB( thermonuclease family)